MNKKMKKTDNLHHPVWGRDGEANPNPGPRWKALEPAIVRVRTAATMRRRGSSVASGEHRSSFSSSPRAVPGGDREEGDRDPPEKNLQVHNFTGQP